MNGPPPDRCFSNPHPIWAEDGYDWREVALMTEDEFCLPCREAIEDWWERGGGLAAAAARARPCRRAETRR